MSNTAVWTPGAEAGRSVPADPALCSALDGGMVRVAGRIAESIVDGPGLRYVLFTQGCPHHCPGCHNPETHDFAEGTAVSLRDILADIRRNPLLRGVTFSGGEPFSQSEALLPLAAALKSLGYHLMAYTGYVWEDLTRDAAAARLLPLLDVLVDGPFMAARRSLDLRFRGSTNQRILDVPAGLREGRAVLHPLHGPQKSVGLLPIPRRGA